MQPSRYFMSDQSENSATQTVVESFKQASDAKAKLEGSMRTIGHALELLGKALQEPSKHLFTVDEKVGIAVKPDNMGNFRSITVMPAQIDWNCLCEMLSGYNRATEDKKRSAALLRDMGLPIHEG